MTPARTHNIKTTLDLIKEAKEMREGIASKDPPAHGAENATARTHKIKSVTVRDLVRRINRKLRGESMQDLIELGQALGCIEPGAWFLGDGPSIEDQGTHLHLIEELPRPLLK
jgi:hypothetical protein